MRDVICFHNPEEINGYLSNWYLSEFEAGGVTYSSMEQYMMYQKAVLFGDDEIARQIIVYQGLFEKFSQNEALKKELLATKHHLLAECAVQDKIWGIG